MRALILGAIPVVLAAWATPAAVAGVPTAKPGGFHSPDLAAGQNWDLYIPSAGTYYYHCKPHPVMQGTIEVTEDALDQSNVTVEAKDFKFEPATVRVRPNTTLTFTNRDSLVHTVTESNPPSGGGGSPAPPFAWLLGALAAALLLRRRD